MTAASASVRVAAELRFFLPVRYRHAGDARVVPDGTSTVGHAVESLGVPRTEVGELRAGAVRVPASRRLAPGDVVDVLPVRRPEVLQVERFVLDVHLGALARRMRLLGLDTAYRTDADDPELVAQAIEERRTLLTRDRGLLRRRALPTAAYVRGDRPDDQVADVVQRFAPTLAPWTRCPACNHLLAPARLEDVRDQLEPGTRRSFTAFSRCPACGRVFWRGAHAARLEALVERASRAASTEPEQ